MGVVMKAQRLMDDMIDLEIECLPANLPEYIEIDMEEMAIGQVLHISDLNLPEGVESVALKHGDEHDLPVVTVNKKKAEEVLDDVDTVDAEGDDAEGDDADTPDQDAEGSPDAE